MTHYTEDELTLYHYGEAARRDRIERHLHSCESCAAMFREITRALAIVGDLDVPERNERYGLEVWQRIRHDLPPQDASWWMAWYRPALMGILALLMVTAFVAGRLWPRAVSAQPPGSSSSADLTELHRELHEMREMLTLSLMQQQSASERLRGVSSSNQVDQPGTEIVGALLDALRHDSNVNVRLACVDALRRFSAQDVVRRGTVQALAESSFPLVQIALIDFMIETKDREAVGALRRLSQDATVNEAVRDRAAWGLQQLS